MKMEVTKFSETIFILTHDLSNSDRRTTFGVPTTVYWYAALI
jgi:hypothetical protein